MLKKILMSAVASLTITATTISTPDAYAGVKLHVPFTQANANFANKNNLKYSIKHRLNKRHLGSTQNKELRKWIPQETRELKMQAIRSIY